jgi:predicted Zn-dependent protease
VKINSIAATVTSPKAKGLHDILAKADAALKNDEFKSAIEQFNAASFVAPNNQMIALGRANANLAAGYYATAEQDIRRAVSADAAVLMAQMDLGSMISGHRLDFVKKDLKDLADKNPKESRPWFLLAYINYNTGDGQAAANDLEEAKQRSGTLDITIQLMQQYWQLPAADNSVQQKPELNK